MGWFDSTNAILGIAGEQRAQREETASRKRENWQKLMDLANAGVDVWNIVSGRKYQTQERIMSEAFQSDEAAKARQHAAELSKKQFDWKATFDAEQAALDRGWRENQNQLDRELQDRIANLDRAAQTQNRQDARKQFLADWTQRAYQLALSNKSFLDETGNFDPTKREAIRKFLYTQVDNLPADYLSSEEIEWAKRSFDGFVDGLAATPLTGGGAGAGGNTSGYAPISGPEALATAKDILMKLSSIALPPEVKNQLNQLELAVREYETPSKGEFVIKSAKTIRDVLTKLTTLYNTYAYGKEGSNRPGALTGDLRVTR